MRMAADCLVGEHDFSAFRSSGCVAKMPVRTLKAITIKKSGDFVEIYLEANSFLMHMARIIVGTLVEVGLSRHPVKAVKQMLMSGDRSTAGKTAPASGLYLMEVFYPEK
jgi:tRNA pseudouridine38-40 synthase